MPRKINENKKETIALISAINNHLNGATTKDYYSCGKCNYYGIFAVERERIYFRAYFFRWLSTLFYNIIPIIILLIYCFFLVTSFAEISSGDITDSQKILFLMGIPLIIFSETIGKIFLAMGTNKVCPNCYNSYYIVTYKFWRIKQLFKYNIDHWDEQMKNDLEWIDESIEKMRIEKLAKEGFGDIITYQNEIIYEKRNDLEWFFCPDRMLTSDQAKHWIKNFSFAGEGWRFPKKYEFERLFYSGFYAATHSEVMKIKVRKFFTAGTIKNGAWVVESKNYGDTKVVGLMRKNPRHLNYPSIGNFKFSTSLFNMVIMVRNRRGLRIPKQISNDMSVQSSVSAVARDGNYLLYNNNIILDEVTNLEWFVGPDKDINWKEAKNWVHNLTCAGGNWRLPAIEELYNLYQEDEAKQNISPLFITGSIKGFHFTPHIGQPCLRSSSV